MKEVMRSLQLVGIGIVAVLLLPLSTYAQTLESPSFRFEETTLGNGGLINSSSPSFQSGVSVGDTAVGSSESGNFQFEAGSQTTDDPALNFTIENGNVQFGSFTASGATTATSTFSVINYTSYNYAVHIVGNPPSNGAHTIEAMASNGPSVAGTEQFGINLVANTSPTSVGANPDLGDFGVGAAASNYDTSNEYRFVSGEVIASAPESSGKVTYTISYLVNVDSLTPGGQYTANHTLICTGTY